jgi:hypothetical protein
MYRIILIFYCQLPLILSDRFSANTAASGGHFSVWLTFAHGLIITLMSFMPLMQWYFFLVLFCTLRQSFARFIQSRD